MQKPQFIKVIIPAGKGDITPQVKQFFNKMRGLLLEVEFSNIRRRKIFRYEAKDVKTLNQFTPSTGKESSQVTFVLIKKDLFFN